MTASRLLARRYARALFLSASAAGQVQTVEEDLDRVLQVWGDTFALREVLGGVLIPRSRQKELLERLFQGRVTRPVLNLVSLLLDERRLRLLEEIRRQYRLLADEARGIILVEVVSARPLPEEAQEALREALEKKLGRKVRLETSLDPNLIGGVRVKIGDRLYDGSVRGQLERLRQRLAKGR